MGVSKCTDQHPRTQQAGAPNANAVECAGYWVAFPGGGSFSGEGKPFFLARGRPLALPDADGGGRCVRVGRRGVRGVPVAEGVATVQVNMNDNGTDAALWRARPADACARRTARRMSQWRAPKWARFARLSGLVSGGEGGIRTLDELLTHTHFPGALLKPLGHLSKRAILAN